VAAATLLAEPLRRGVVAQSELAAVRARRLLPTVILQTVQRIMHRFFVRPILDGRRAGPPRPVLALMQRVPRVRYLTAYLIGIGPRPEHAPAFAKRPASTSAERSEPNS
jgi:hypothetical protein